MCKGQSKTWEGAVEAWKTNLLKPPKLYCKSRFSCIFINIGGIYGYKSIEKLKWDLRKNWVINTPCNKKGKGFSVFSCVGEKKYS